MHLVKRKKKIIVEAMRKAANVYQGKGRTVTDFEFTETEKKPIHTILADNEFESTWQEIEAQGIKVNITAKEEYFP
jgi:hypothetical protein